jgi:4'-phosphopantetheinyl transferase EntD
MEIEMPVLQTYTSPLRGVWKITETFRELMDLYQPNNEEFRTYINNMKSETRKKEYIAVRLLLRHLLGKEVQILYNRDGSPYLTDNEYFISISHTKGYAGVILSGESSPGIDIEYRSERALTLKKRFLNRKELYLMEMEKSISPADFATVFWCAKETAFKSLKCENVDFIKHLGIFALLMKKNSGTLLMRETRTDRKQSFAIDFEIADDRVLTWKG